MATNNITLSLRGGLALLGSMLLLAAVSCGAGKSGPQLALDGLPSSPVAQAPATPAVPLAAAPAGISLPTPDSIRSASAAAPGRFALGNQVLPALLSTNAAVIGNLVELQPNWDGTANFEPAWAGFELDMSGQGSLSQLYTSMEAPGSDPSPYFGLANWERNTWQWFHGESNAENILPNFAPYIRAADSRMLVVVLVLETDSCILDWLRAGDPIAPLAVLKADVTSGPAPLGVFFDTMDSFDPDSPGFTRELSLEGGPYITIGSAYHHTYTTAGTFQASLRIETSDGMVATDSIQITVDGYRPTARLTATPTIGQPGQMVNFDASGSFDQGGGIVSFSWDLDGDGSDDTGGPGMIAPSHQFMNVGTYHPRLTVTDNSGYTASEYVTVVIGMPIHETEPNDSLEDADHLPTVPFHNFLGDLGPTAPSGPGNEDWLKLRVTEPGLYNFNLLSIPVQGDVDFWVLDQSGGLIGFAASPASDEQLSMSLTPGYYYVKVYNNKLNDNAEYALVMSANFTALPVAVLNVSPDSGDFPLAVTLSAVGSYDPDGTIVSYEWDPYGDSHYEFNTGVVNQMSFTYKRRGTFEARLRVTDNSGAQTIISKTVVVNGPPLDEVEPNNQLAEAQLVSLPLSGFTGDCGYGGGSASGQSNPHDYIRFNGLPGSGQVNLQLEFDDETAALRMRFYRINMGNLVWIADSGPGMTANQQVLGVLLSNPGDYAVIVYTDAGSSEYSLNAEHLP